MAASTNVTKLVNKVAALAGTVTGLVGRVYQGKKEIADSTNVENAVRALTPETQGYFTCWFQARRASTQTRVGAVVIGGLLVMSMVKDTDSTLEDLVDTAERLASALMVESAFLAVASGVARPLSVEYTMSEDGLEDGIVEFSFTLEYQIGMTCGA